MGIHRQIIRSRTSIVLALVWAIAPTIVCGWNTHTPILQSRGVASLSTRRIISVSSPIRLGASDSDTTSEASTEQQPQPLSESDRKELVDALFKGSSNGSNQSGPDPSNDTKDIPDTINGFLDKQFFDPDQYDEDDDSFFGKIANFVKNDYELFEAVFVACFFLVLITVAKDLLRAQMVASGVGGKLF